MTGGRPAAAVAVLDRRRARRPRLDAAALRAAARAVLAQEGGRGAGLNVVVVDDAAMRRLNRAHLGHDWATDAITFGYDGDPAPDGLLGEVVVSAETAAREAARRGHAARAELLLYVAHGVLHLLGHDDDTPARRRAMNARAAAILRAAGLPAPPERRP